MCPMVAAMSSNHHPIIAEFPDHRETIHRLKMEDAHFQKLVAKHEDADKEIVRMEGGIENPEDSVLTELKKVRLGLKDEILEMIQKAES